MQSAPFPARLDQNIVSEGSPKFSDRGPGTFTLEMLIIAMKTTPSENINEAKVRNARRIQPLNSNCRRPRILFNIK